jgi:hypothetical protein
MSENMDHISDLEQRLYARDPESVPKRKFGILRPLRQNTSSAWGVDEKVDRTVPKVGVAGFKRFFIFAFIFFVLCLGLAFFSFFKGAILLSSKNVDINILGNSFVAGGEELPIQIEIANKNSSDLIDAKLVVNYPKGATDNTGSDLMRIERNIGTISSGKSLSEEFSVILYGEQGVTRDITAVLSYKLVGANSSFEKSETTSILISSSPVNLVVDAPSSVVPNQQFSLDVRSIFNGENPIGTAILRVEYPQGFVFDRASPEPMAGNNVWRASDLAKSGVSKVTIQGRLMGEQTDEKSFRIYIGAPENDTSTKISVAYSSVLQTISLSQPFINGGILVNDKSDSNIALPIGENISGKVLWSNTSGYRISNAVFTLHLDGQNINRKTVLVSNGFYNELENNVVWSSESESRLIEIANGDSGSFDFSFDTISDSVSSRDITLSLSIAGKIIDTQTDASIANIDKKNIVFSSDINFDSIGYYSVGTIKNTGPIPPKANIATTYTITWSIRPVENQMSSLFATATLPAGVTWNGLVMPVSEDITFNPDNRIITWNIGNLPKATSIPKVRSVSFQIGLKPTMFQVGSKPRLLSETTVTGIDGVSGTSVIKKTGEVNTQIIKDPVYDTNDEFVIP